MGNAFWDVMPFASPGDLTRPHGINNTEPQAFDPANPFPFYGAPGKIGGGKFVPLTLVGDTQPYGFLQRVFPTRSPNETDPFFGATPPLKGVANVMTRGYMGVLCRAGVPALGGTVYYRYANAAGGTPLLGLEATTVVGSNVALLGVQFQNGQDSNGLTEIRFNAPNQ